MSELLELAAACERATESDRTLDGDIALAIGWEPDHQSSLRWADTYPSRREEWINDGGQAFDNWKVPRFTASIDAAMTLVPEKGWWAVAQRCSPTSALRNFGSHNGIFRAEVGDWSDEWVAESDFPALALCAAALRSQAPMDGGRDNG